MPGDTASGEFRMGELTSQVKLCTDGITSLSRNVNELHSKIDDVNAKLAAGAVEFQQLHHKDELFDLRLKTIELAKAESAQVKQNILMMVMDKAVGVILPWSAIAYLLFGKTP